MKRLLTGSCLHLPVSQGSAGTQGSIDLPTFELASVRLEKVKVR